LYPKLIGTLVDSLIIRISNRSANRTCPLISWKIKTSFFRLRVFFLIFGVAHPGPKTSFYLELLLQKQTPAVFKSLLIVSIHLFLCRLLPLVFSTTMCHHYFITAYRLIFKYNMSTPPQFYLSYRIHYCNNV